MSISFIFTLLLITIDQTYVILLVAGGEAQLTQSGTVTVQFSLSQVALQFFWTTASSIWTRMAAPYVKSLDSSFCAAIKHIFIEFT